MRSFNRLTNKQLAEHNKGKEIMIKINQTSIKSSFLIAKHQPSVSVTSLCLVLFFSFLINKCVICIPTLRTSLHNKVIGTWFTIFCTWNLCIFFFSLRPSFFAFDRAVKQEGILSYYIFLILNISFLLHIHELMQDSSLTHFIIQIECTYLKHMNSF